MNQNIKRKYQVTLMSAIDELQRCYKALNTEVFNSELPEVIISIQSDTRRQAYAWITVGKVWSDQRKNYYHEINMVAEWLNRPAVQVVASLVHEMVHLWNMVHEIQDTSRAGSYHNKAFFKAAIDHWLECSQTPKYGYCRTAASKELQDWVEKNVRSGCFRYQRAFLYADGTPKVKGPDEDTGKPVTKSRAKSSSRKYVCPKCGLTIRATKDCTGKLRCIDCDKVFIEG